MQVRKVMNALDNERESRATDMLLNYETVKYFCNENFELASYDLATRQYQVIGANPKLVVVHVLAGTPCCCISKQNVALKPCPFLRHASDSCAALLALFICCLLSPAVFRVLYVIAACRLLNTGRWLS